MTEHLHNDMCQLRVPGARASDVGKNVIARCLPAHLRYTCQYWVLHIQKSPDTQEQNHRICAFIQKHFLNELETLSLLGKLDDL
jgi:hypothetical protein